MYFVKFIDFFYQNIMNILEAHLTDYYISSNGK